MAKSPVVWSEEMAFEFCGFIATNPAESTLKSVVVVESPPFVDGTNANGWIGSIPVSPALGMVSVGNGGKPWV